MDKRKLNKEITIPEIPFHIDQPGIIAEEQDGMLILNCFDHNEYGQVIPKYKIFCDSEDYTTWDYTKGKWKSGCFYNIDTHYKNPEFLDGASPIIIKRFVLDVVGNVYPKAPFANFYRYQDRIMKKRREKRYEKEYKKIDADMDLCGELPSDYQKFIKDKAAYRNNYIFYNKKNKISYCTRCEKYIPVAKDMYHNKPYVCPSCNTSTIAKADGLVRGDFYEPVWSGYTENVDGNFIVRYFCHDITFHKWKPRTFRTSELYRTVYKDGDRTEYMKGRHGMYGRHGWTYYKTPHMLYQPSRWSEPIDGITFYNDTFDTKGTCVEYSCLNTFRTHILPEITTSGWWVDNYLGYYQKMPSIEQIIKLGWYNLAAHYLTKYDKPFNGKNILETLNLSRSGFLTLRELSNNNPKFNDLNLVHIMERNKVSLKTTELQEIMSVIDMSDYYWDDNADRIIKGTQYASVHKLVKYIKQQSVNIHDYFSDYLSWIKELGYDMKNEFNLFPKNFEKRHEEVEREYLAYKDEKLRQDIEKFERMLAELKDSITENNPLALQTNELFIRLPYSMDEIRNEGQTLHHCVATYIDKVMQGKTQILFIREKSNPDKPFYTMEWKENRMVQCRGLRNCDMTPEVKAFATLFTEKMQAA